MQRQGQHSWGYTLRFTMSYSTFLNVLDISSSIDQPSILQGKRFSKKPLPLIGNVKLYPFSIVLFLPISNLYEIIGYLNSKILSLAKNVFILFCKRGCLLLAGRSERRFAQRFSKFCYTLRRAGGYHHHRICPNLYNL